MVFIRSKFMVAQLFYSRLHNYLSQNLLANLNWASGREKKNRSYSARWSSFIRIRSRSILMFSSNFTCDERDGNEIINYVKLLLSLNEFGTKKLPNFKGPSSYNWRGLHCFVFTTIANPSQITSHIFFKSVTERNR